MTATPDSWTEFCRIGIKRERDSNEVQFAGITEDITALEIGEKDIEGVPLLNGGRAVRLTPMSDGTLTMKMYPVKAGLDGERKKQENGSKSTQTERCLLEERP